MVAPPDTVPDEGPARGQEKSLAALLAAEPIGGRFGARPLPRRCGLVLECGGALLRRFGLGLFGALASPIDSEAHKRRSQSGGAKHRRTPEPSQSAAEAVVFQTALLLTPDQQTRGRAEKSLAVSGEAPKRLQGRRDGRHACFYARCEAVREQPPAPSTGHAATSPERKRRGRLVPGAAFARADHIPARKPRRRRPPPAQRPARAKQPFRAGHIRSPLAGRAHDASQCAADASGAPWT
jgi:hypothetical protein